MIDCSPNLESQLSYIEREEYAGYDPYDGLNSPLLRQVSQKSKLLRIAATQVLRRSPVNLRPVLGVRKGHNPKAMGLFLWGYCKLQRIRSNLVYRQQIEYLLRWLNENKSPGYSGNCWGYNFDWQSRTFFRPAGVPTIVNTAFIGHALLDCYELLGRQQALDMAISIQDFLLKDLHRTEVGDTFCFSYTPVDTAVVHNANMLGASILMRLQRYDGNGHAREAAAASLAYSLKNQRTDGSWVYAETRVQQWIDSFHTGFNLQALRYCLEETRDAQQAALYRKGVRFYAENFFLNDGTPKYYHDRVYPIDIHCPAVAIVFFSGMGAEYHELTDRIMLWMLEHMWSEKGYFYFRKHPMYTNQIPYMRWSQAWGFHALTEYLFHRWGGVENELERPWQD